ncbi:MAG: GNAT family protein [Alkalibacterium sp.]|nr:GNAT family protein [Alkalibacterium sp.]
MKPYQRMLREVLRLLNETATQTGFMTQGSEGVGITTEEEEKQLADIYESSNNCVFVATCRAIRSSGSLSIHASDKPKIRHIGDIGIVIDKAYWGYGLGTLMMEELLLWADESPVLSRLQLQVQERNTRARHMYEKLGFKLETIMERGVRDEGDYLNVCLMSKLI